MKKISPPRPKKIKKNIELHGDIRVITIIGSEMTREKSNVINYLKAENAYTAYWFKENEVDSEKIFQFYKNSLPRIEEGFKTKIDNYQYFSKSSISNEYRKYYRIFKKKEKLILDVNKLAKNKKFYEISSIYPSRNHKYLAYGEDKNGRREFSIVVKDINNNINLENNSCSSSGKIIWNKTSDGYFYLKKDPKTLIADSLFFHKLKTSVNKDKLIFREKDKQFNLNISISRTKKYLFLEISKTESNETWFLDLDDENFNIKCFLKRKNKHLYYLDDTPDNFFILSNRKNKKILHFIKQISMN